MGVRLSRRKIAAYVADQLLAGTSRAKLIKEVAAYLSITRRTRETTLLVRDIEDALAVRGLVIADIVSAHELTDTLRAEIRTFIGAKNAQLRETVDASVLGGVCVDIPGQRFDGTLKRKINALRATQV